MSQSKLSKSKTKIALQSLPSADILHKGYQRKIAQSEYIKTFPKMRLRLNGRNNTANLVKNERTEEFISEQVENMKEENRKLQLMNQELVTKIRKETKFNEIYEKKMEKCSIQCMSFQKLLEIKLLLEVQELEENLRKREEEMENLLKVNKKKKDLVEHCNFSLYWDLHAVLLQNQKSVENRRQSKELQLKQTYEKLDKLCENRQKLKNKQKKKEIQLNSTKITIEKENHIAPNKQEVDIQSNDVSLLGGINRSKNIEDVETEIQKIKVQSKELEIKMQQEIDIKVREKLLIMKEMQEYNKKIQRLKIFDKNKGLKIVDW